MIGYVVLALTMISITTPSFAQELIARGTPKIEEQMAVINSYRVLRDDDITVKRFRFLLTELAAASAETPTMVSDKITKAREILRDKYGKDVGLLTLTEAAYKNRSAIKPGHSSSFFAELLMLYGSN